jgi:peptidoglycan/xylan/chitin deacetylase (PgdA/CDA1 family)
VARFWKLRDGGPFGSDLDDAFEGYLLERHAPPVPSLRDVYYRLRPIIPIGVRRALQRWQARRCDVTRFPRWPIELSLIRFHQHVLRSVMGDRAELPYVGLWPGDRQFAFVLTHDVDSAAGFARIGEIARIERDLGFRSAWFVVPELYPVDWERLARLVEDGFEIGIHGLRHDGRLFASRAIFEARLPRINEYVRRCGAVGFRSPATLRRADWLQEIAVDYDASYFDTDPFEPQPGGTCSWWPFFLGRLVELPYTLPQDFTLFEKLRLDAAALWIEKLELIERYRGMALMLTHPDYLDRPERRDAYARALQWVAKQAKCWHALPREVAQWWRARAAAHWQTDGTIDTTREWGTWRSELRPGVIRLDRGELGW